MADTAHVTNVVSTVSSDTVWSHITAAITAKGWSYDPNAIYFLIIGPNVKYTADGSCAWHSVRYVGGKVRQCVETATPLMSHQGIAHGVLHNKVGCTPQNVWAQEGVTGLAQGMAESLFHEAVEAISDFDVTNGWWRNSSPSENADICA